jgi:hypothetical protein
MNTEPRECFPLPAGRARAKQTLRYSWLYARFGVLKESDSFGVTHYAANGLVDAISEGKNSFFIYYPLVPDFVRVE